MDAWRVAAGDSAYELTVETEVFWRRGGPPDASERRVRAASTNTGRETHE